MPFHDVNDAFDVDFWDTITVIRRIQTISAKGRGGSTDTPTAGVQAVVDPAPGNLLERLPDYDAAKTYISVVTPYRLQGPSTTATPGITDKPDLVQWAGTTYIVVTVDNCSRYGAGFMEAICASIDYQDAPPTPAT